MKLKQPIGMRALVMTSAFLLLCFAVFYSCKKTDSAQSVTKEDTFTPANTGDRLLSVANVYNTQDGKTTEVWFYETPLVFEFSANSSGSKQYFRLLEAAKKNQEPINIRLIANTENQIAAVIAPDANQLANYRAAVNKRQQETAIEVSAPDGPKQRLTGVVPDITTLNNIFNTLKNQCCKAAGPYIYGQCIPFQYVADGCYARAHKMRQVIEGTYGYTSYKVFNYACNQSSTLSAKATLWNNNCCVKWWYHVTSYVIVQVGASQYGYALDPAMFSGPVSIPTWIAAQQNTTCGYNGTAQGQVYYQSNAYAPSSMNTSTCTLTPFGDNTYTAANATCAAYAPKKGCF